MNKICIIAAMEEEMTAVKSIMTDIEEKVFSELSVYEGKINGKSCVLTKSSVGKVNAARTTQILIDNYSVDYVINVGSAGSINDDIACGDIIIAREVLQYDFDITAFGYQKGYISNVGLRLESSFKVLRKCEAAIKEIIGEKYRAVTGTIATGDIFCTSKKMKEQIKKEFGADCVEMEGGAVAQVCYLSNVPFIIIRSISDSPNEKNEIDFKDYLELASKRCAEFLKVMIK